MIDIITGDRLDEETRAALASGRAHPAVALFIESALSMRNAAEPESDALNGALLERESPALMAEGALQAVFARIDALPAAGAARAAGSGPIVIPAPLRAAVEEAERKAGWKWSGSGIRTLDLVKEGGVKAQLLRIEAGKSTPRHTHAGREYTLCLHGGFSDSRGSYGPGDIATGDPTVMHTPTADDDGPCLVLAITDADLKFTGLMGLLQRLTGG